MPHTGGTRVAAPETIGAMHPSRRAKGTMCTPTAEKFRIFESEYIPVNKTELVSAISTHTDVDLKTVATVLAGSKMSCRPP